MKHVLNPLRIRWCSAFFVGILVLGATLGASGQANAGIYDADAEVTYKEYWVPHSVFNGGFHRAEDDGGNELNVAEAGCPEGGGDWYLEAWPKRDINGQLCEKVIQFDIPDDFSQALKVEIYLDLWRNQSNKMAMFRLNSSPTYRPDVGLNWSRTPWISEINKSHLVQGTNTMTIWTAGGGFHIHDMAFRIYFDDTHPLRAPGGAAISAPSGSLLTIAHDGGVANAAAGGDLVVNNDTLTLTAAASGNVKFVEFHGFYDGYDEDNDGLFRDWHNRGRNNWHPGGTSPMAAGGTVDHIGTDTTADGSGHYEAVWDLPHIANQAGVKFKVRVVDNDNVVREAAGGVSGDFTLKRNRAVHTFYIPNFRDNVLHHNASASEPGPGFSDEYTVTMNIPSALGRYAKHYFLGAYWLNPKIKINSGSVFRPFNPADSSDDVWLVSKVTRPLNDLQQGNNSILYTWSGGFGQFIEKPGPMIVLAENSASGDSAAPYRNSASPSPNSSDVPVLPSISVAIADDDYGVDATSLIMRVNGQAVTPVINGFSNYYTLTYEPPAAFNYGQVVTIQLEATDLAGNVMPTNSYSFTIEGETALELDMESDNFNVCTVDGGRWTWVDSAGDSSYAVSDSRLEINVPRGVSHDVWSGGVKAPRLSQAVENANFEVIVEFENNMTERYQLGGLLFLADDQNLVRVNFQHDGSGLRLFAASVTNGTPTAKLGGSGITVNSATEGDTLGLRVIRNGSDWEIAYSVNGGGDEADWVTDPSQNFSHSLVMDEIGIFAGNNASGGASIPPHTAIVNYVLNQDAPIDVADATILRIEDLDVGVSPSGEGGTAGHTAGTPVCSETLSLTATANPGWRFAGWDIGGPSPATASDNPLVRAFEVGSVVIARFEQIVYSLRVDVINKGNGAGGSVQITPEEAEYLYAEPVTVTAVTPAGWIFEGWSGAFTGSEASQSITVTQDIAATATFSQEVYSLAVSVGGSGNGVVTVDGEPVSAPAQTFGGFVYEEAVTLQALAAQDGSRFAGWSGDVPAGADTTAETLTLSVAGDAVLNAVFVNGDRYVLTRQVTPDSAAGSIAVTPEADDYGAGTVVTLEAVPQAGWRFAEWGGSVSGSANPVDLEITADTMVIARFVQEPVEFRLYLPVASR